MAHHPKWQLVDKKNPTRKVVGRLQRSYIYKLDGDLNFQIKPNNNYQHLIEQGDLRNKDGRLECEIETLDRYEDQVLAAFDGALGGEVFAYGVWVNDTPHGSKFELHPLDALVARLRGKDIPLWTDGFKEKYKGTKLYIHRVFAGADQSDRRYPPLTDKTRSTVVEVPFPKQPRDTKAKHWEPDYKLDIAIHKHSKHSMRLGGTKEEPLLLITITPRSFTEGEPGLMLFDVITFWKLSKE